MHAAWLMVPFLTQGAAMVVDEFHFHHKRGLPKWERVGHPLDTITVLACFVYILVVPFSMDRVATYAALVIFSCIFVTKDEFVHAKHCVPAEQWLHAVLFVLHPIVLTLAGLAWPQVHAKGASGAVVTNLITGFDVGRAVRVQTAILACFLAYQIIYWNVIASRAPARSPQEVR